MGQHEVSDVGECSGECIKMKHGIVSAVTLQFQLLNRGPGSSGLELRNCIGKPIDFQGDKGRRKVFSKVIFARTQWIVLRSFEWVIFKFFFFVLQIRITISILSHAAFDVAWTASHE